MTRSTAYREVAGTIRAPASKSSMQRATACALLAEGRSILRSPSRSADCLAALGVARGLGATVEEVGDSFAIEGAAAFAEATRRRELAVGAAARVLRRVRALHAHVLARGPLLGREACSRPKALSQKRSVAMIEAPLRALGAECETAAGLPPVRLRGPLRGGSARVDGRESSQLLTGLLVALPLAAADSTLEVAGLASRGYVELTLDTMRAFGIEAERDSGFERFDISGSRRYRAADFTVEGDWSGAAFLLVAGALAAREGALRVLGLERRSSQPDRAILDALRSCGAELDCEGGSIGVSRGRLDAFEFDATDCPDLFPPLVALALACEGETALRGARRLRGKESDRAAALSEEFAALGGEVEVEGDIIRVLGAGSAKGGRLAGGRASSRGDHRIAMAAAIASLYCESPVSIEGAECVSKSWPTFFEDLAAVAR